jgi:hypothetical protein
MSTNSSGVVSNQAFVVLASGGWGFAAVPGDAVYLMTNSIVIPNGAATTVGNGDAIYVGNYGRPVAITVSGHASCSLNYASSHYDSQSQ